MRLTYSIVFKLAVIVLEGTRRVFRELSFRSRIVLYDVRMGNSITNLNLLTPSSCQLSSRLTCGTMAWGFKNSFGAVWRPRLVIGAMAGGDNKNNHYKLLDVGQKKQTTLLMRNQTQNVGARCGYSSKCLFLDCFSEVVPEARLLQQLARCGKRGLGEQTR